MNTAMSALPDSILAFCWTLWNTGSAEGTELVTARVTLA